MGSLTDNVLEFPKSDLEVSFEPEIDQDEVSMVTAFIVTQINGLAVSADIRMESAVYACLRAAAHAALEDGWSADDFEAFCKSTQIEEIELDG